MNRWIWIGLTSVLFSALVAGCGDRRGGAQRQSASVASQPIDTLLMAYLSKARAIHHAADMCEESGDQKAAIAELTKLAEAPVPGGEQAVQEAKEVIADTMARLAELRSQLRDYDQADRDIDRGLEFAPKVSFFEGHLIEVQGVIAQRRAKAMGEKGDAQGQERERARAFEAFDRAVRIQDQVIDRLLRDAGGK